jgi:hypothetical protein
LYIRRDVCGTTSFQNFLQACLPKQRANRLLDFSRVIVPEGSGDFGLGPRHRTEFKNGGSQLLFTRKKSFSGIDERNAKIALDVFAGLPIEARRRVRQEFSKLQPDLASLTG